MKSGRWRATAAHERHKILRVDRSIASPGRRDVGSRRLTGNRARSASDAVRSPGAAAGRFCRAEHGGLAIETAVAVVVFVVALAGVTEIVRARLVEDQLARAAGAVARELSLDPTRDACAAVRRELDLADDFDCAAAPWTLKVDRGIAPDGLPDTFDASVTEGSGDIVVVRMGQGGVLRSIGLARCEAALCGRAPI